MLQYRFGYSSTTETRELNIREDAFSLFLNRVRYQENSSISLYIIQTYVRQMCSDVKAEQLSYVNAMPGTELETLLKVPANQYAAVRKLSTDKI